MFFLTKKGTREFLPSRMVAKSVPTHFLTHKQTKKKIVRCFGAMHIIGEPSLVLPHTLQKIEDLNVIMYFQTSQNLME